MLDHGFQTVNIVGASIIIVGHTLVGRYLILLRDCRTCDCITEFSFVHEFSRIYCYIMTLFSYLKKMYQIKLEHSENLEQFWIKRSPINIKLN